MGIFCFFANNLNSYSIPIVHINTYYSLRSAIVTGCNPWTLYEYNNFQGRCACVYPSDQSNCYPGFYQDLGNVANQISSVKRGCYCNKKLAPAPPAVSKKQSNVVGQSFHYPSQ